MSAQPVVDLATGTVVEQAVGAVDLAGLTLPDGQGLVVEAGETPVDELLGLLRGFDLEPGRVRVRLCEHRLVAAVTSGDLERLRLAGHALGVVGWGPGGGTVALLRRLDVAEVVVEPRTIEAVATRDGHAELLALTSVALAFGRRVTATGVATPEQLSQVRLAGCTHVQGPVLLR